MAEELTDLQKVERIKQLKKEILTLTRERDFAKAMQLALKLVLNGTYGAHIHPAFTVSNTNIANSITALAREVINYMLDNIEDYFYDKWGYDTEIHKLLGVMYISKLDDGYYIHRLDGKLIDNYPRTEKDGVTGLEQVMMAYKLDQSDVVDNDKDEFVIGDKTYEIVHKIFIHDFSNVQPLPITYSVEPDKNSKKFDEARGVREKAIVIYGDTDSIFHDTIIHTSTCKTSDCTIYPSYDSTIYPSYTIEELYNKCLENGSAGETLKGHESVLCNDKILNYSDDKKLYYAPVKRIIRHKVTKAKWKLKTKSGKEITITNDHSMIVFRDGKQVEVKPCDILNTDKILCSKISKK